MGVLVHVTQILDLPKYNVLSINVQRIEWKTVHKNMAMSLMIVQLEFLKGADGVSKRCIWFFTVRCLFSLYNAAVPQKSINFCAKWQLEEKI